jgi:hypothetical protein
MATLRKELDKSQYDTLKDKTVRFGKLSVTVHVKHRDSQSGSWERGFKFTTRKYGYLTKRLKGTKYYKPIRYSADHGRTWHPDLKTALRSKGKVILETRRSKEMAFDSIQSLNRQWDPGYQWKP